MGVFACVSGGVYLRRGNASLLKKTAENLEVNIPENCKCEELEKTVFDGIIAAAKDICPGVSIDTIQDACAYLEVEYEDTHFDEEDITEILNLVKPLLVPEQYRSCLPDINIQDDENDAPWGYKVTAPGEYEEICGDIVYEGGCCERVSCAFEYNGHCQCHKVHGRYPEINGQGCSEYLLDKRKGIINHGA